MLSELIILVIAIAVIIVLDISEEKRIRNTLFLISMIPLFYIAVSFSLIMMEVGAGTQIAGAWYADFLVDWATLSRLRIYPEETYPSFMLGILLGIHIAFLLIYTPRSRFLERREARESIEKIMCTIFGLMDGIFIGGVLGLVAVPIALILYRLMMLVGFHIEVVDRRTRIRNRRELLIYLSFMSIYLIIVLAFSLTLSIILGALVGIRSPTTMVSIAEKLNPYLRSIIIGLICGWIGSYGGIIFGTILAVVGWLGYIRNILPYGAVAPVISAGRDISGTMGAVIGAMIGTVLGSAIEYTIRKWRYLKEKMRELALKEKRAKFKVVEPEILKKIVRLGVFDIIEAVDFDIPSDAVVALFGSGILESVGGKMYEVNWEKLREYIRELGELGRMISRTAEVPTISLEGRILEYLGELGVKNLYLVAFDPRRGPVPICALRYTHFAETLFSDTSIPVTLSNISRTVTEAKIGGSKLMLRTYTTKFHGRDLYHIVCAEIVETREKRAIYDLIAEIAEKMGGKESTKKEVFEKVVRSVIKSKIRGRRRRRR